MKMWKEYEIDTKEIQAAVELKQLEVSVVDEFIMQLVRISFLL